jgi:hypothetical protein
MIDIDLRLGYFVLLPFQVDNYIFFILRRDAEAQRRVQECCLKIKALLDID